MSESGTAPYEALVGMIEHELELATAGRLAELRQANEARAVLMARLPSIPPPGAAVALQRAELMHTRLEIELERRRETLLSAISELEQARRAARGYMPPRELRPRFSSSA
jgi:hypothetical protein